MGQVNLSDVVRFSANTDGSYSLRLPDGTILQNVAPVYALSGITITGVDTLPDANTFDTGSVVRLHPDNFVGTNVNPIGVFVVADALNNIWRPYGPQRIWGNTKTLASPISTLTAAGAFNIGIDPIVPGGLLRADSKVVLRMKYRKVGVVANQVVRATLGTDMSVSANNSIIYTQTVSVAASNRDIYAYAELDFESTTTAFTASRAILGGGGADNQFGDLSTLLDTAADMKLILEASTLAADTVHLLGYGFYWEH